MAATHDVDGVGGRAGGEQFCAAQGLHKVI